jgi:hypothetical protein
MGNSSHVSFFFLRAVLWAVRGWARGMFKIPNCFFFFGVKSKGIREWDMGFRLPNCFLFFRVK